MSKFFLFLLFKYVSKSKRAHLEFTIKFATSTSNWKSKSATHDVLAWATITFAFFGARLGAIFMLFLDVCQGDKF